MSVSRRELRRLESAGWEVVEDGPHRRVVRQRHLVVGEGAEDLRRRHDQDVPHPGGRGGEGEGATGPQQRRPALLRPTGQRRREVRAGRDPDQDVHPGQLGQHPWPVGVDRSPAHPLEGATNRREHAYLRDALLLAACCGEEPRDPQRRHADLRTGSGNGYHGHPRGRGFALGGTDGGTQRVLLVVV